MPEVSEIFAFGTLKIFINVIRIHRTIPAEEKHGLLFIVDVMKI